jgi:hypothetical protein
MCVSPAIFFKNSANLEPPRKRLQRSSLLSGFTPTLQEEEKCPRKKATKAYDQKHRGKLIFACACVCHHILCNRQLFLPVPAGELVG